MALHQKNNIHTNLRDVLRQVLTKNPYSKNGVPVKNRHPTLPRQNKQTNLNVLQPHPN